MVSPKIKAVVQRFKGKEKEVPTTQDALGAYPLRMQISSIPERRYLRTARILAVFTFINIGILMALAGAFIYYSARLDVRIANSREVKLYSIDPENKVIIASEHDRKTVNPMYLVMEQAMRDYITARNTVLLDKQKQQKYWGPNGAVSLYSDREEHYQAFQSGEAALLMNQAASKHTNKEVHIYSIRQIGTGLWQALIDVFDMPPEDPFNPMCNCSDNSKKCLDCKIANNQGRHRFKVFVRSDFLKAPTLKNPFGVDVWGYYALPQVIHKNEIYWGVPAALRPEL